MDIGIIASQRKQPSPIALPGVSSKSVLFMGMDGADNGKVFTDEYGAPITNVGAPVTKTGIKRTGVSSAYLSPGNYLTLPNNPNYAFGKGDFTIALSFYLINLAPLSYNGSQHIGLLYYTKGWLGGTVNNWALSYGRDPNTAWRLVFNGGAWATQWNYIADLAGPLSMNAWHDVIIMRKAGVLYFIVDEVVIKSMTCDTSVDNLNTQIPLSIGYCTGGAGPWSSTAYIDNVHICQEALLDPSSF